jgi:signal transduction histidine kinase
MNRDERVAIELAAAHGDTSASGQVDLSLRHLSLRQVDLERLAADVVEELSRACPHVSLPLIEVLPLPTVFADEDVLRLALANLVANAIKFTRSRVDARVEVGGSVIGSEVTVFVRDNGVGFNPLQASGFEDHGVGLGIERHGGRVWARSSPGHGACFFFSLPIRPVGVA